MRNGDFVPTRLQAQQDAVNLVCHSKTRSNPENNVGLITLAKYALNDESYVIINDSDGIVVARMRTYKMNLNSSWFFYSVEVLATLTSDVGRILSKLHQVQPNGKLALVTGIRIAHVSAYFV